MVIHPVEAATLGLIDTLTLTSLRTNSWQTNRELYFICSKPGSDITNSTKHHRFLWALRIQRREIDWCGGGCVCSGTSIISSLLQQQLVGTDAMILLTHSQWNNILPWITGTGGGGNKYCQKLQRQKPENILRGPLNHYTALNHSETL